MSKVLGRIRSPLESALISLDQTYDALREAEHNHRCSQEHLLDIIIDAKMFNLLKVNMRAVRKQVRWDVNRQTQNLDNFLVADKE